MQEELVQHCHQLLHRAQRGETLLEQVHLTLIECAHLADGDHCTLHRLRTAYEQAPNGDPTTGPFTKVINYADHHTPDQSARIAEPDTDHP